MSKLITLTNHRAIVLIDPFDGGRVVSIVMDGLEILRDEKFNASGSIFGYGSFPMAPYSGRIRNGKFEFQNQTYQLADLADAPHALHGTVIYQNWQVVQQSDTYSELTTPIEDGWPFNGSVTQHFELTDNELIMRIKLTAKEDMPAWIGFHPWFRKEINSSKLHLSTNFEQMYRRDETGITTKDLINPTPAPWDDCFYSDNAEIKLSWGEVLEINLTCNYPYWVIYSEPEDAICIEPQSAPPNAIELAAHQIVSANESIQLEFKMQF